MSYLRYSYLFLGYLNFLVSGFIVAVKERAFHSNQYRYFFTQRVEGSNPTAAFFVTDDLLHCIV